MRIKPATALLLNLGLLAAAPVAPAQVLGRIGSHRKTSDWNLSPHGLKRMKPEDFERLRAFFGQMLTPEQLKRLQEMYRAAGLGNRGSIKELARVLSRLRDQLRKDPKGLRNLDLLAQPDAGKKVEARLLSSKLGKELAGSGKLARTVEKFLKRIRRDQDLEDGIGAHPLPTPDWLKGIRRRLDGAFGGLTDRAVKFVENMSVAKLERLLDRLPDLDSLTPPVSLSLPDFDPEAVLRTFSRASQSIPPARTLVPLLGGLALFFVALRFLIARAARRPAPWRWPVPPHEVGDPGAFVADVDYAALRHLGETARRLSHREIAGRLAAIEAAGDERANRIAEVYAHCRYQQESERPRRDRLAAAAADLASLQADA